MWRGDNHKQVYESCIRFFVDRGLAAWSSFWFKLLEHRARVLESQTGRGFISSCYVLGDSLWLVHTHSEESYQMSETAKSNFFARSLVNNLKTLSWASGLLKTKVIDISVMKNIIS